MIVKFCPVCEDEVAADGGVCPEGHDVAVSTVDPSPWTVRDEVEAVFAAADLRVEALVATAARALPGPLGSPPAPPAPPVAVSVAPPPPPPPPPAADRKASVWGALETAVAIPSADDPIQVFAPPPHMDWGPAGGRLLSRLRARKTA